MLGKFADTVIPGTSLAPARGDTHAFALTSLAPIASTRSWQLAQERDEPTPGQPASACHLGFSVTCDGLQG